MTIQIGTDECEPGTVAGEIHAGFIALYGAEAADSAVVKGVAFSIAQGIVEGFRNQIADGEVIARDGDDLTGVENGGGAAPDTAEYIVGAPAGLTNERVVTNTPTVTWDLATAGQAKANVPDASTTAKGVVELATSAETTAGLAVQASDTRLSNARTPTAHATSHQNGGSDELNVAGLSGELADPQPPKTHAASHSGGALDEIVVLNLGGYSPGATTTFLREDGTFATPTGVTPSSHAISHETGGTDEINVNDLAGELADPQKPKTHSSSHENGGGDEINVAGLSGELADPQPPKTHATSHQNGGSDPLRLDELAGPTDNTNLDAGVTSHGLLPKLSGNADEFLDGQGNWTAPTPKTLLPSDAAYSNAGKSRHTTSQMSFVPCSDASTTVLIWDAVVPPGASTSATFHVFFSGDTSSAGNIFVVRSCRRFVAGEFGTSINASQFNWTIAFNGTANVQQAESVSLGLDSASPGDMVTIALQFNRTSGSDTYGGEVRVYAAMIEW